MSRLNKLDNDLNEIKLSLKATEDHFLTEICGLSKCNLLDKQYKLVITIAITFALGVAAMMATILLMK